MRKIFIALGTFFWGILYATIWTKFLSFAFNYRVIEMDKYFVFFSAMFICFYCFGVYFIVAIFRLFFKQNRDITSAIVGLVHCALSTVIASFLIIFLIVAFFYPASFYKEFHSLLFYFFIYILFGMISTFHLLVLRITEEFNTNKSIKYFIVKTATVLLANLTLLVVVCISSFPGVHAPIDIRQKWAYKEFEFYPGIVDTIKETNPITDQVGQIKFVAPTKGRNIYIPSGDSSGPRSKFTLEVVGEKGIGIAYIDSWGGGISNLCFEYQGKKTKVWGSESCN